MSEKRYVAINKHGSLQGVLGHEGAARRSGGEQEWTVHELGPEVKEPDYGPLVEWVRQHHKWILGNIPESNDLKRALKAAGVD